MRTIKNILIIGLLILAIFHYKDDLKSIYAKVFSFVERNESPIILDKDIQFELDPENKSKLDILKKIINTPEPLRVIDPIITGTINNKTITRNGIIEQTNINRADESKLAPLKENKKLNLSAQNKVKEMFINQYFEHVSPVTKKGVSDLGTDVGYEYLLIGENLALGTFKDDADLVRAWMDSPGHRANILNTHYTEMGAAVGTGMFEGREVTLAVQHFGTPKSACPTIEKTLETSINLNKEKLDIYQNNLSTQKKNIDNGGVVGGKTTNEQINEYNQLVLTYNNLLQIIREQINTFNGEVNDFNACVNSFK